MIVPLVIIIYLFFAFYSRKYIYIQNTIENIHTYISWTSYFIYLIRIFVCLFFLSWGSKFTDKWKHHVSGARTGVHTLQSEYLTNEKMELTGEAHLRFSGPFSFLLLSGPFSQLVLAPYFYSINTDHRFTILKIAKVTRISLLFPIFSIHHFYLFYLLYRNKMRPRDFYLFCCLHKNSPNGKLRCYFF